MAFSRQEARTPAGIGGLIITLKDVPARDGQPAQQGAAYQVEVLDAGGQRIDLLTGNLVPHLTTAQINALLTFMADLRTQAKTEILPT